MLHQQVEPIDATTRDGFLEIAGAFGRDRAHETRIAQLEALLAADSSFRWFGVKWQRKLDHARFEREYEAANPQLCALMRDAGIGY